ncbi:MAG: hypothetical protein ACI976_003159 [Aureispira sp.]|jgi:hypothetical protein
MKQKICILLLFIPFVTLLGQSLSSDFEFKNPQLQKDVYRADFGTKGLLLTFDYLYNNSINRLTPIVPRVTLAKNGMEVYLDETKILVLSHNTWSKGEIFVPYRAVNLLNGVHEGVQLNFNLEGLLDYGGTLSYQQPLRYTVELNLKDGGVKEQLEQYDQSFNPKEWLPDVYYLFTTNEGTEPVYRSVVYPNSYSLSPNKLSFHLLEGEQLKWSFYDRDGENDQHLGTYTDINPGGDYSDAVYGQMFDGIKNLEFDYTQRAQARQALSIYSDANYVRMEKKGVAVTIEYDLAKAYQGKKAAIHLNCYDKNGIQLDVPVLYPVEGTPAVGSGVDLQVKGKLKYFIPFYIWKEACKNIEFYFELEDKEQIQAARHTLHKPIQFEDWVIEAGMNVEHDFAYQGAKGVRLLINYELASVYENAPLFVKFYNANGDSLPFPVYHIIGPDLSAVITKEHVTENPKIGDEMSYFIPYVSLADEVITVQVDLVPDVAMSVLQAYTEPLPNRSKGQDVVLELVKAGGRFRVDNYGQVVELKLGIPDFFINKTQLKLDIQKNGKASKSFLLDGLLENENGDFVLKKDSGRVYIVFPHRNMTTGTRLSLSAVVTNLGGEMVMSNVVEWKFKAPNELFNTAIEVALMTCKFNRKVLQDTLFDKNFPWNYVIEAGGAILFEEPLSKRLDSKQLKEQFKQKVLVNREDNITIKLVNTQNKETLVLWHGDLGKWEQSNLKAELSNEGPVKIMKVSAAVDKNYNANNINGALE